MGETSHRGELVDCLEIRLSKQRFQIASEEFLDKLKWIHHLFVALGSGRSPSGHSYPSCGRIISISGRSEVGRYLFNGRRLFKSTTSPAMRMLRRC